MDAEGSETAFCKKNKKKDGKRFRKNIMKKANLGNNNRQVSLYVRLHQFL